MTVGEFLAAATKQLEDVGSSTARLDVLVIMEDVLKNDRSYLLAHQEQEVTSQQLSALNMQLRRRSKHEPLAYIRQKTEFYGREFYIDHRVLEPRPESETMMDLLKDLAKTSGKLTIVDIGT